MNNEKKAPVRIILPFKKAANSVRRQLVALSEQIVIPCTQAEGSDPRSNQGKRQPLSLNQLFVVYHFKCNLYDGDYANIYIKVLRNTRGL